MKAPTTRHSHRGFTLLELTVAMLVGLMISAATLALFNNQLMMFTTLRKQNFLLREAPQINSILNKIVPRANAFQMFTEIEDVDDDANGVIAGASVLALRFQESSKESGTDTTLKFSYAVIAFNSTTGDLNYYNNLDKISELDPNSPSWKISSNVNNAVFYVENGVIRIKITGHNQEEITFSSTTLN